MMNSTTTPQVVGHLAGVPVAQISAGEAHSLALSMSGSIYSWGKNDCGQLGLGHMDDEDFPSLIEEPDDQEVEFLTCGGSHSALLTKDGLVFTFGSGKCGQLGHNSVRDEPRPHLVTELIDYKVTQIACGRSHTLAYVSDSGMVFSFGSGREGQLGNCGTQNQLKPLPMKLPSKEDLTFEQHSSEKELILVAGGNQSILLWMKKESSYVNLRRKITTLNEGTVKRWIGGVSTSQQHSTKREIREIFSFPACLTGSFLKTRQAAEPMFIHLDLNKARDTFKELNKKDWIAPVITTCLMDNRFRNLPVCSPHQEALEVFLLLQEYFVMQDSYNWESLVVPFAKAVCKMRDQSLGVLETYWASWEKSNFDKLVQMLKKAIVSQVVSWEKTDIDPTHIQALLEVLKKLHRVNQTTCQLSENAFHVNELSDLLNFYSQAFKIIKQENIWETPVDIENFLNFSHFPFVFNTMSKIKLLNAETSFKNIQDRWMMLAEPHMAPTFNLKVRRSHLIVDVFNQLSRYENEDLRKELLISFSGEIDYDFGGVRREFFHCVFEEMTRPDCGMFVYPEEASCMWFPIRSEFEEKKYFFFGVLCGLLLFNSNVANVPFPLALFKKLLDQTPSVEDLKELSPTLGKGLQTLLDDEGDDFEDVYGICFKIHWDKSHVELIPNGSTIMVNQTNKREYVSKYVDYIFNVAVKEVYEAFQRGFYRVCTKEIIDVFHPEELKNVLTGIIDYDWKTFEKNAQYCQGYSKSHHTIVMFWEALHKLTLEEKKKFLVFLTGTDRLQTQSLRNMKITIRCPEYFDENYPMTVQTCFSTLTLPKYSTMERMEEALQVAINNNRGFG
ncbi:E3 ISG15--protein ligase HERC5 [Echinops telfairi]|uniref:E3 ISG15--protein ligase HERC5 n=1 Tax=Echinops telfairi TaxID=9371 RepID=A0ABM0ZQK5_ECHTE|nr:E3 ISG15--protein ligase HERC5 [Echinops telfairi]